MRKFLLLFIIALVFMGNGCNSSKGTSLNFAVEMNDHAAAAYVAKANKTYEKYGIKVNGFYQYATGMELAAALSRGDINVGYICVIPAIIAYSRGVPIKIVSLTHEYGYELVAQKNINNVNELNRAEVACPGEGSAANFIMKLTEEKYNVKFNVLRTKPVEEITLIEKGSVKAVFIPEHYASILHSKGFNILLKSQDIFPNMPGSCVVVKDSIIEDNPSLVKNLIKITEISTKFINSNRDKAVNVVAKQLNCDENTIRYSMNNLVYTTDINKEAIQREIDILAKWGYIKRFSAKDILWEGN
jgi:NitT/TauT family transport system substrate-binding protein